MTPRKMLLLATGSLAGLALALLLVLRPSPGAREPEPGAEHLLPAPLAAPDFELTAHTGDRVRLAELGKDRVLALFFGYTHCPDVCPLTMANLGRAIGLLGDDAGRVQGALVTVDPARDSAAALAEYVARFPSGIVGLTGESATLEAAAKGYMVYAERAPEPPAHDHEEPVEARPEFYLIEHTGRTLIVRDGRIVMTFPPQTPAPEMAAGLRLVLR
jgi:protein SCO1/2